jgi:dihydroxyacetone kinase
LLKLQKKKWEEQAVPSTRMCFVGKGAMSIIPSSSILRSIFFSALAQGLEGSAGRALGMTSGKIWTIALTSTLAKLYTYTRARPPSRTLVDPLAAFVESFKQGSFGSAVKAAQEATEATKNLDAKAGRSAYVGDTLKDRNIPDPGAWGVKIILESLQR